MKKLIIAAAMLGASFVACAPAQSATLVSACSAAPLDIVGITAGNQTCAGYFAGRRCSGNAGDVTDQKAALAGLGFDTTGFDFNSYTKLSGLAGLQTINFGTPLSGIIYLGIHYGAGQAAPRDRPGRDRFLQDRSGRSIVNSIQLQFGATSDAVLYSGATTAVPEVATWAMMIAGLGLVGASMRRRKPPSRSPDPNGAVRGGVTTIEHRRSTAAVLTDS